MNKMPANSAYTAWRISYQSSEQAARAAFQDMKRISDCFEPRPNMIDFESWLAFHDTAEQAARAGFDEAARLANLVKDLEGAERNGGLDFDPLGR